MSQGIRHLPIPPCLTSSGPFVGNESFMPGDVQGEAGQACGQVAAGLNSSLMQKVRPDVST